MSALDYDKISLYVDNDMTAGERQDFEQLLRDDEELKKEVELYREVNESLKNQLHPGEGELALKDTIQNLRGKYFSTSDVQERPLAKTARIRSFTWIAAAAAILIIALFVWAPWSQPDTFRQFASIEMPGLTERGGTSDSIQKSITKRFNEKKFAETIPQFETLLSTDTANSFLHFYYAIALLETDQLSKSRIELTQLYNGTSVFRYEAAFYIALSYLKDKNETTCKEWLNKIPADAPVFSKAQRLLKEL